MKRILIVEDEEKIRNIYKELFFLEGYEAFEAKNVIDATRIINEVYLDLIILDILLPGILGSRLFELIRRDMTPPKVIVASVYPLDEQKNRIVNACDYFDKSHSLDELLGKVRLALLENK